MYRFRVIGHNDICEWCRCGAEVAPGDEVTFIGGGLYAFECDVCPSCQERRDEADEREGEVIERWVDG